MLATSARSPLDIGSRQESGTPAPARGSASPAVAAKQSENDWKMTSVFTGDTTPTVTYAAAAGVGGKAELKEGPDNDRYSIITPALGATASGTWNLFTGSYDFMPSQKSAPVDSGLNVGGRSRPCRCNGRELAVYTSRQFEFSVNGGLGAAARVEIYEVGLTPGKVP